MYGIMSNLAVIQMNLGGFSFEDSEPAVEERRRYSEVRTTRTCNGNEAGGPYSNIAPHSISNAQPNDTSRVARM